MAILRDRWTNISQKLAQFLPAQPCVLCGSMSTHGLWCADCEAALPYLDAAHCPVCALPSAQGEICGQCLKEPPPFDRTTAVFAYQFPINKLIQQFKYAQELPLARQFALQLARQLNLKLLPNACTRIIHTPPQASLARAQRLKNMHGAFQCHVDLSGKRVALVDDVLTTGASLKALAAVVRAHGAVGVDNWVVARTLGHD